MPQHKVSLSFKVEGVITELLVYANGLPVKTWRSESKFVGGFTDALIDEGSKLDITFVVIGLNGTDYKISSQFQDNGKSEDGSKPNPIEGRIIEHLKSTEVITYTI